MDTFIKILGGVIFVFIVDFIFFRSMRNEIEELNQRIGAIEEELEGMREDGEVE